MNTPAAPATSIRRRRLQLIAVALVFFGPLLFAFWIYYGSPTLQPAGHVAHGDLIAPARPLPAVTLPTPGDGQTGADFLRRRWSIVYVAGSTCDAACEATLADARAIHLALLADSTRVRRVFLCARGCVANTDPGLEHAWLEGPDAERLLTLFPAYGTPVREAGRLYLVDPLGNLLMSYPPGTAKKGMLKDLEKLLRLSHIG
jgi:cytochrome oxidase Cu insertion factor (SCO1/SenC/PrrC family)